MTDEEARALAWCKRQRQRAVWQQANAKRLAGNPTAREQLDRDWKPILSLLRDRRHGKEIDEEC